MPLTKMKPRFVDVKCGCCNETCLDCPRIYFSYWGKNNGSEADQLDWWRREFCYPMMVRLKQELSENNTTHIHITTTLRHLDNFPRETEGARFLSIFPTTVGKPHDIKHLVTHCSKFFQMLAEVFSDIGNVNVTHYVMSNIGCVRSVDVALYFLHKQNPRIFNNFVIKERSFDSYRKQYDIEYSPIFSIISALGDIAR